MCVGNEITFPTFNGQDLENLEFFFECFYSFSFTVSSLLTGVTISPKEVPVEVSGNDQDII